VLKVAPSTVSGTTAAPPSKSYTHRALVLGLLSERSEVVEPLLSEDPLATLACVERLGAKVERFEDRVRLEGGAVATPADVLDAKNSGTTLRILTAVSALAPGTSVLTGDASLRRRPMQPLFDALRPLGVEAYSTRGNGCAPVVVRGTLEGGETTIAGDVSSQFVSAILLAATRAEHATDLILTTPLKSRPYVDITLDMIARFGGAAAATPDGFSVPGGQALAGAVYRVPGDWSSAAFPWCAAAVTGGEVTVTNLDMASSQGDRAILGALEAFGCNVKAGDGIATVRGGDLRGIRWDLSDTPDMFPALAAVAAHARGETVLSGAAHLRYKESDRIAAMVSELRLMGVDADERPDGAVIRGGRKLSGAKVTSLGDHRIEMALVVAGLAAEGATVVDDHESHAVSYPRFLEEFARLGARLEVVS